MHINKCLEMKMMWSGAPPPNYFYLKMNILGVGLAG